MHVDTQSYAVRECTVSLVPAYALESKTSVLRILGLVHLHSFIHSSSKQFLSLSRTKFSEKAMAPHSSTLAWRIPGTAKPGGLPSMGLHRVGNDWSNLAAAEAAGPSFTRWGGISEQNEQDLFPKRVLWGGESATHNHNWKFSTRNGKYKCIHCDKLTGDKRNMVP